MAETIFSACSDAMESSLVLVECSFLRGFAGIQLVGNATEVCKNGLDRAKAVVENNGFSLPQKKIIISLAPADSKKDGSQFDLAFALSLAFIVSAKKTRINTKDWLFVAELSLEGELRAVKNIISYAVEAASRGLKGIVIPKENLKELQVLMGMKHESMASLEVMSFSNFAEVLMWIWQENDLYIEAQSEYSPDSRRDAKVSTKKPPDFDDMILSEDLYKIALVTATGLHSLLLYGTPGTGKSMFSARINSILPPLSKAKHLDVLRIHSSQSQFISAQVLAATPPFRAPHHQASPAAILGIPEMPGEVSLAHGGILFLDEFPEFRRDIIESLREPLETGLVRVSRARRKVTWKSRITLIAACNLCPCGWFGSSKKKCVCPMTKILNYRRKMSGPILDRIDLHVNVMEPPNQQGDFLLRIKDLKKTNSQTKNMREHVISGRKFAANRNKKWNLQLNSELSAANLLDASGLDEQKFLAMVNRYVPKHASQRSLLRSLRVARTLADLEQRDCLINDDLKQAWAWQAEAASKERGDQALGLI